MDSEKCVICGREIPEGSQVCVICGDIPKKRVKTNYDRIRNMSVEELAKILGKMGTSMEDCRNCPTNDGFCDKNIHKLGCSVNMFREWLVAEVTG